jgi:Tol biopolymer transport system component
MSVVSRLLIVFVVVFCVSGCGGGSSSSGSGSASTGSSASGGAKGSGSGKGTGDGGPAIPPRVTDRIIYIADGAVDGIDELYLGDTAAPGVATRLNAALVAGGNVTDFVVNADHTQVLYRADQDIDEVFELYLVDLDNPGSSTRINGLLVGGGDVMSEFRFSPDGSQVVYRADEDVNGVFELFLVNIATPGFAANLSGPQVSGGDVLNRFLFTADGTRVLYFADEATNGVNELFMVDVAVPGVSTRVNGALTGGGDVSADFVLTPDGARVVYRADETTDNVVELFIVDLAAPGSSTTLSDTLVGGGDVGSGLVLSPDGALLAYRADQILNDVFELFVVELANPGVSTRINRNPASGGDVLADGFVFSPASDAVAYVADEDVNNVTELYLVELASPAVSIKLNSPLVAAGDLTRDVAYSGDGNSLFYVADQDTDAMNELYRVSRSVPGASVKINAALAAGGNVTSAGFAVTSNGEQLVYLADQDVDEDFELYIVDLDTPAVSTRLNAALPVDGDVLEFILVP